MRIFYADARQVSSSEGDDANSSRPSTLPTSNTTQPPNQPTSRRIATSLASFAAERNIDIHSNDFRQRFANNASWFVNWFLLFAKLYCVIISSSKAIAASLADSVVDLLSQGVLALGEHYIKIHSPDYPVGRSRLEALAVLACAGIMSMASVEVIQYSCIDLYSGFSGSIPELEVNDDLYIIMGLGILLKWVLFLFCKYINEEINSDSIGALAEDHLNDVLSNTAAIITAAIAYNTPAWYVDPFGAIVISLVIIGRWMGVMSEQVRKVVGYTASPEFIERVNGLARAHDERLAVDCTRAYHFGSRYNVEMEIILPGEMTVQESHDIALALQHKIESLEVVERAFVHVDHLGRDGLEHKVERQLVRQAQLVREASDDFLLTTDSSIPANELRSRYRSLPPL